MLRLHALDFHVELKLTIGNNLSLRVLFIVHLHCVKCVRIWSYSGPHFSRTRTEYREIHSGRHFPLIFPHSD